MKINIRPDPDCFKFIGSEFEDRYIVYLKKVMIITFLKSVGIPEIDAENWAATHTIEINENNPPLVTVFNMRCSLSDEIFAKSEWVFKLSKEKYFTSFIISGHAVCCDLLNSNGLKHLPKNLLNLHCSTDEIETLNEHFQELKNIPSLKRIIFNNCKKLKNISLLDNLVNLESVHLGNCLALVDISNLAELVSLQSLYLSGCNSLTNISCLSKLVNLKSLILGGCDSLKDISYLSGLLNLQSLSLDNCKSLTDISDLSRLVNLKTVKLTDCKSLTDISSLARVLNLETLNLNSCESLTDVSGLSGLLNLQSLNLSYCKSLTDISSLAGLLDLQSLDLKGCKSLTYISSISLDKLLNLQSLNLSYCESLTDVSGLAKLINLQSLDLAYCESLTDISSLAGLLDLQSLKLNSCKSLTDISILGELLNLQSLDLSGCKSLTDISGISGLVNLKMLDLYNCPVTDINCLSGLLNLQSLYLYNWDSLTDTNVLSRLLNLQSLCLNNFESITDISDLSRLLNLKVLNIEGCMRIQSFSPLRRCLALNDLKESKMHPAELAELLCFLAIQRKDIFFIYEKTYHWLNELVFSLDQNHTSTNDLACSLAQGIVLANLEEVGLSFHQTLVNHSDIGISPWKIWFSENLKTFGWDKFQKLAELSKPSELTFGAIGGISSCLSFKEGDPTQIAWAKKWISEIHSLHNNNPNFLKPAAAEWCLALKRLGEDELLRGWIEKFTDPSDLSALDPIKKVFSAYALDLNNSESALEYAFKINDPKIRDESILNLAQQFIKEGETTKSGEFLFLLTQVESRTQLAYSLAEDAAYLKSDENAHRLLAACGDSPQSLASILDKLRLANPDSEILEIMHEKLSDESISEIPASLIMQESNSFTNTLFKIKDPSQLVNIQQAIDSIMKSS